MINLKEKVGKFENIIILRHLRPDFDALGSQIGLKEVLSTNFPDKKIYVTGDTNKFSFIGEMDEIADSLFDKSLIIVLDVAVSHLVSDERYKRAKEIIVIDHHQNKSDLTEEYIIDNNYSSCAELVASLCLKAKLTINKEAAEAFLYGIIGDTGRFLYPGVNHKTFNLVTKLLKTKANLQLVYKNMYLETLESKKMKSYFANEFSVTADNVAYLINDKTIFEKFNVDVFTISRGMVNVMSGIEGINIWVNFTFDEAKDVYLAEIRSRDVSSLDVAKKYGGGGHLQACGASLKNIEEVHQMLEDLNEVARKFHAKNS
ncbi:MAG: bifunctional oligoribonuclease/PAP phosphatase NrnA [Erysipelotrichales bacterium]|nr:bifunctional oligoribonuclease/PAP phosphatase NrnA [Erysipelotrichales bacterium]